MDGKYQQNRQREFFHYRVRKLEKHSNYLGRNGEILESEKHDRLACAESGAGVFVKEQILQQARYCYGRSERR